MYQNTLLVLNGDSWWRHQMETFSALLTLCAGNSPVTGEFPAQRPVTRSFDVFFDLRLSKRLNKQSWGWWFETLSHPLWRHCNVYLYGIGLITLCRNRELWSLHCKLWERVETVSMQYCSRKYLVKNNFRVKSFRRINNKQDSGDVQQHEKDKKSIENSSSLPNRKCQDYVYIKWKYWSTT